MAAHVKIDPRLRQWIELNLDRGCPPRQLVEGMIAQRFGFRRSRKAWCVLLSRHATAASR